MERAWEQQRQFVADASHELKTPLTVILTNAELLREGPAGEEERRRLTDNILTMARQMRALVEGLLELARADPARSREGGWGLGLPIAQEIAVRHGGKIWADSGPEGDRFTVKLPLLRE